MPVEMLIIFGAGLLDPFMLDMPITDQGAYKASRIVNRDGFCACGTAAGSWTASAAATILADRV